MSNKNEDKYMAMIALRQAKLLEDEICEDDAPSAEFVERMKCRIEDYEKKGSRKLLRKRLVSGIAACLTLVIIAGFGARLTTQANKSSIAEFFSKYFSISHTDKSWDIAANAQVGKLYKDIYLPSWMPENFQVSKSKQDDVICIIVYTDGKETVSFQQHSSGDSYFDNEISNYESFTKDGQKYYYCEKGKPAERKLIWEKEKRSFKLTSGITKEELINIAESMAYKK